MLANACNRGSHGFKQVWRVIIGTPIVRRMSTRMRENSYERLSCSESCPIHVIPILPARVKCEFDRFPELLPLNDNHRGLQNTHDLAKVALTVLHHRPRRLATHPAASRNSRAKQVVDESKSIEKVNALAIDRNEFRIVIGAEWNAKKQSEDVRSALHVGIPTPVVAFGLEPAVKAARHNHIVPLLAIDARRLVSILLANDDYTMRQIV